VFAPIAILLVVGSLNQIEPHSNETGSINWLTGANFRQELEHPFSGSWSSVEFRQLLKEVAADRRVAIILDRRLDPSVEAPIDVNNVSLRTGLTGIARQVNGDVTIPENIVFLGPKSATKKLRTLIELRELDLQSKAFSVPKPRRSELLQRKTFESQDLDAPREILETFAQQVALNISNGQLIPHDLWAGMVLPDVTIVEAVSVVLIQFDLTFRWIDQGAAIELIPIPDVVALERKHHSKQKPVDAINEVRERFPQVEAEVWKTEISIKGLLEDHEAVADFLRGDRVSSPIKIEPPQPLQKQLFTLKAERVPLISLLKKLEESAINFDYDSDQLTEAGVDLEQKVQIDVKKASAKEFFKLLFDPVGLEFQIDHLTVKLKPKKR
jgi:hypothetical protein